MDAAAELGRNPVSKHRFSLSMEMSRLTRDGTAEPVSRDQILRHARGQGNIIFSVQLTTSRIGNLTRLILTLLYVMTIHTYIHTYTYINCHAGTPEKQRRQNSTSSNMAVIIYCYIGCETEVTTLKRE